MKSSSSTDSQNAGERLDSWKEIAAFFDRDERTVKRWEKERGLPVHRVPGGGRGTVFAYAEELKTWMSSSQPSAVDSRGIDSHGIDARGVEVPLVDLAAVSVDEVNHAPIVVGGVKADVDAVVVDRADVDSAHVPASNGSNSNNHKPKTYGKNGRGSNSNVAQAHFSRRSPVMQYSLSDLESSGTNELEQPFIYSQPPSSAGSKSLFAAAVILILGALFVAGGWRYVKIRSVQGYLLPSVGLRHPNEARRQAEEFYLQGRFYWSKRTPEGLTEAADCFTKSTQADPSYALAYVGLADSYNLLREYTSMPGSQAFPLSLAASRKALELDPALSEAHRALAFAEFNWEWNIPAADHEYHRAIELNPEDPLAHHWYATMLLGLGRMPEALAEIQQARKLDPTSPAIAADRAAIFAASGRTAEAISQLQALESADPKFKSPHAYLAQIYFRNKQYENYFAETRELAALSHDQKAMDSIAALQRLFLKNGEDAFLEAMLQEQIHEFQHGRGDAIVVADTYIALGRNREAQDYLEKSFHRHEYQLINLRNAQEFSPLQHDPAFQDLLRRLKLTANLGA